MKHYVKWLQVFPNKNALTSAKCDKHNKVNVVTVNGRTAGLTRTHTIYVCSAECLWEEVLSTRWVNVKEGE